MMATVIHGHRRPRRFSWAMGRIKAILSYGAAVRPLTGSGRVSVSG
jgi:hypothetical protein